MLLQTFDQLDPAARASCWTLYTGAFDELRTRAVQRHVMVPREFDEVMRDRRVTKYVVVDPDRDDRICGLATLSNDLDAVPLVSPDYFARRWPDRYEQRRIWYVGFVAVHPDYRGTGVFATIVAAMCRVVSAAGGIAALDMCRHADEVYELPQAVARLVDTFAGGARPERLDEQSYWAYEFPAAI